MWVRLCKRLREAEIAHADLQHGNVLLVPGETANKLELRLIDYDGMWVPALAGKPSGEVGHPAYQHPARLQGRAYTADVDRFPHLVIGCALRAVAVGGKPLWDKFDNGDNLLFREADFADPSKSKVFRTLWAMDDPTITNLCALLAVSSRQPLKATPWLDDVLSGEKAEPVSDAVLAKAADLIGVDHRAAREAAPVSQLYVVPEEANAFADLWSDDPDQQKPRRRKKVSLIPLAVAGGIAAIAAGVLIALMMNRGDTDPAPPPHDPGTAKTTVTATTDEGPGPGKRGVLKTEWVALPAAVPAAGPKSLADGIDGTRPGFWWRAYGTLSASQFGVWLMPDGGRAVLARANRISILNLETGNVQPAVQDVAPVRATVTPDGRYAVIADKDRIIRCFDMRNGLELFSREFPAEAPVLLITPDGKRVAMTADGVGYAEWSIPEGKEVRRHESLQASLLDFSPDGTRPVAGDRSGAVELWDLDEGKATILSPAMQASAVCFSADGSRALAAGDGPEIRVWDIKDGKRLPGLPLPVKQKVTALAAIGDGTIMVGSEAGQIAYVPETGAGAVVFNVPNKDTIAGFALTGDGKHVLAATEKMGVYLVRTRPKARTKFDLPDSAGFLDLVRFTTAPPDLVCVAVSPAAKTMLVASQNRLFFHDLETFRQENSFRLDEGRIVTAGFTPDDRVIVTQYLGDRAETRIVNVKTGELGPPFIVPGGMDPQVSRIVPVPKTRFIIGGTNTVGDILLDTMTRKVADGWPAARGGDAVVAAASHDGKVVAFGALNRAVQLWDTATATTRRPFEASTGFHRLAFTPDDTQLIGLGRYGRIRVWEVETGKVLNDVAHTDPGPLDDLVPLGDDLVAISPIQGWMILDLKTGKLLGTGEGADPISGRGTVNQQLGWILAVDTANRLAAWKVNREKVASAPARPPRDPEWPDAKLVRDAPKSVVVGLTHTRDGDAFVVATADRKLTRYSADKLLFGQELDIDEGPREAWLVSASNCSYSAADWWSFATPRRLRRSPNSR